MEFIFGHIFWRSFSFCFKIGNAFVCWCWCRKFFWCGGGVEEFWKPRNVLLVILKSYSFNFNPPISFQTPTFLVNSSSSTSLPFTHPNYNTPPNWCNYLCTSSSWIITAAFFFRKQIFCFFLFKRSILNYAYVIFLKLLEAPI